MTIMPVTLLAPNRPSVHIQTIIHSLILCILLLFSILAYILYFVNKKGTLQCKALGLANLILSLIELRLARQSPERHVVSVAEPSRGTAACQFSLGVMTVKDSLRCPLLFLDFKIEKLVHHKY